MNYYEFSVNGEIVCVMANSKNEAIQNANNYFDTDDIVYYGEISEEDAFWLECDIY